MNHARVPLIATLTAACILGAAGCRTEPARTTPAAAASRTTPTVDVDNLQPPPAALWPACTQLTWTTDAPGDLFDDIDAAATTVSGATHHPLTYKNSTPNPAAARDGNTVPVATIEIRWEPTPDGDSTATVHTDGQGAIIEAAVTLDPRQIRSSGETAVRFVVARQLFRALGMQYTTTNDSVMHVDGVNRAHFELTDTDLIDTARVNNPCWNATGDTSTPLPDSPQHS